MPTPTASGRLLNASVAFAIQVAELEDQFLRATDRAMASLNSRLVQMISARQFANPREMAVIVATEFGAGMNTLRQNVLDSLGDLAQRAARAYPRFLNRALSREDKAAIRAHRTERLLPALVDLDPFDASEAAEDGEEEDEDLLLLFFDLSESEIRQLLLVLTWFNFTLAEQWATHIQRQQLQLYQRMNAAIAQEIGSLTADALAPTLDNQALIRTVAAEITRNITGQRGQMAVNAAGPTTNRIVQTQVQLVADAIVKRTIWKNTTPVSPAPPGAAPGRAGSPGVPGLGGGSGAVPGPPSPGLGPGGVIPPVPGGLPPAGPRVSPTGDTSPLAGAIWTAILDGRTCIRCARLHGTFYPFGTNGEPLGAPPMPLHGFCRCFWTPALRRVQGIEQHVMPDMQTFDEWLRSRPEKFQRRYLGPRFELWRTGRVTFKDFVQFKRKVPLRVRTLDSLKRISS